MGQCCSKEDVVPDDQGGVAPSGSRKCRDILCTVFFMVFWLGMVIVTIVGLKEGDPNRLIYGSDYKGTICGAKGLMQKKSLTYYPRINDDLLLAGPNPLDAKFYGLCVAKCPKPNTYICNYKAEAEVQKMFTTEVDRVKERKKRANSFGAKDCWFVPLQSDEVFFRCLPADDVNSTTVEVCVLPADEDKYYVINNGKRIKTNSKCEIKKIYTTSVRVAQGQKNPLFDNLQQSGAMLGRMVGDIEKTHQMIIIIGALVAVVAGCLFLLCMKYCAGCVIWFVCWGLVVAMICFSLFLSFKGGLIKNDNLKALTDEIAKAGVELGTSDANLPANLEAEKSKIIFYQIGAYVCIVFTVIIFFVICFLKKKIKITIGIIREASKAIQRLPLLIVFPIVPFILIMVLFLYWVVVAAYIYSSGGIEIGGVVGAASNITGSAINGSALATIKPSQTMRILFAYHFFGFLWTNQLFQAINMCTIAGSICKYYWSREKTSDELGRFPIFSSFKNCFRYHFGSLVFGSFLIAVVQFLRAILMYIDRQTKSLQDGNLVVKMLLKVAHCCLWCLEKCVKFISKNAYILIAMKGKSFCSSTKEAFFLIFANLDQIGMVAAVSTILLLLAKITIAVGCSVLMFIYIDKSPEFAIGGAKELTSPIAPILLTLLLAWLVASSFLGVYEMAIDTILLCFCEDKKINGTSGKFYMSEELQKYVDSVVKK